MPQSRLPRHVKPAVPQPSSGALFTNPEPFNVQPRPAGARSSVKTKQSQPAPSANKAPNVSPRTPIRNLPRNGPKIFQESPSAHLKESLLPSVVRERHVSAPTGSQSPEPVPEEPKAGLSEPRRTASPGKMKDTQPSAENSSAPLEEDSSNRDPVVSQLPMPRSRSLASVSKLVSKIVRNDHFRASDPGPGAGQARVADDLLLIDDRGLRILKRLGRLVSEIPGHEGKGPETVRKLIRGDKLITLHSSEKEARRQAERDRKKGEKYMKKERPVFGKSLISVVHYAALPLFLGNQLECRLPTVLIKTVEEIYARGFHVAPMFRNLPEDQTEGIRTLIDFHSISPRYGDDEHSPIHTASLPEIAATLLHYLNTLPDPPLDSTLLHAILQLCVLPSTNDVRKYNRPCSPWKERHRIKVAKLVLRLLPKSHFSTLVYLLALLSLVPTDPVHDLSYKDIADIFGHAICGPRDSLAFLCEGDMIQRLKNKDTDRFEEYADGYGRAFAKEALLWLLLYWDYISEGLLTDDFEGDLENFGDDDEVAYEKDSLDDIDDVEQDDDGIDDSWLDPLVDFPIPPHHTASHATSTSSTVSSNVSESSYEMPFRLFQNAKPTPGMEKSGHSDYFTRDKHHVEDDQLKPPPWFSTGDPNSMSVSSSIVTSDSSTFVKSPTITGASALEELLSHQEDVIQAKNKTMSSQANRIMALESEVKGLREERDQARTQLEKLKRCLVD